LNYLYNGIRYFSRRGIADYDAAETYMTNDKTMGPDGLTYISLVDNNTAHTPSSSPTQWARWGLAKSELDSQYAALAGNSAQVFSVAAAALAGNAVNLGQFAATLTGNDFLKIPVIVGGVSRTLIIQWGLITSGSGGNVTWTFPIPFPNACLRAYAGCGAGNFTNGVGAQTTANVPFTVYAAATGAGTSGVNLNCLAIGW
jgi:hypothetical protein